MKQNEDFLLFSPKLHLLPARISDINAISGPQITLRYFQYLAALNTAIVLDRLFNRTAQILADLNDDERFFERFAPGASER